MTSWSTARSALHGRNSTTTITSLSRLDGTTTVGNASASETRSGWIVGTGLEWAFSGNWSAKAEYNYMDFGSRTVDFGSFRGVPVSLDIDQRISVVKAGVNYRFGDNVVVARY